MSDYNDSLQRAQRLSVAREFLLNTNSCSPAITSIENEDIEIYLRWLISHFYSQKSFQQAIKLLEWLPYQLSREHFSSSAHDQSDMSSSSVLSNNTNLEVTNANDKVINNNNNNSTLSSMLNNKFKHLDNIYLPNSNLLMPRDEILNTISFSKL